MAKRGSEELFNKRADYEVQATNGTEHDYPQIAQGLSQKAKEELQRKEALWRAQY